MTHIIYCGPHMHRCPAGLVGRPPDPGQDLVQAGQRTQRPTQKTRKSKPPARIKPWWPVWCAIFGRWNFRSDFLEEILLFEILVFRTELPPKADSGKHSRRCASRDPSNSFIHSCMSCLKQLQVFGQAVSHTRMQSNLNSPSDQVILSSCKHLLKFQSLQCNKI